MKAFDTYLPNINTKNLFYYTILEMYLTSREDVCHKITIKYIILNFWAFPKMLPKLLKMLFEKGEKPQLIQLIFG